tara:strand:+ start:3723 stop:5048 length:1326 start_codon:yes stop_codon:yes gene_type:complete
VKSDIKKYFPEIDHSNFFQKFVFHNIREGHEFIWHPTPLYNQIHQHIKFKSNETLNLEKNKYNIWYVRNDDCYDYVYGGDTKTIEKNIPNFIVDYVNNSKLILLLSTSTEFDTDHFWEKVLKYCESIGIRRKKIFILNSNFRTQLPNTFKFSFSALPTSKYDIGIPWLEKYSDKFPYTEDYINFLKTNKKTKKFMCLNAHYREHRHYIFYKLHRNKLLKDCYFSFCLGQGINHVEHPKERMIEEWENYSTNLDIEDYEYSIKILDELPINLEDDNFWDTPLIVKNPILANFNSYCRPWVLKDLDMISNTYFNIATESTNDSDHGRFSYFSEKAFIGWITQPTIIIGTPFTISHLKSLGFESFSEMFDESYDEIIPNDLRLRKTYREIERVCKLPENELSAIYNDILPKIKYNQEKLFEHEFIGEFKNILEKLIEESDIEIS